MASVNPAVVSPPRKPEAWGVFVGDIDTASVQRITRSLLQVAISGAYSHVHVLFDSPGGMMQDGVLLYNFFRGFSLPLTIYNGGSVYSAGIIAFLGPQNRKVSAHAMFGIHHVSVGIPDRTPASELHRLAESTLLIDGIASSILHSTLTLSADQWTDYQNNVTLSLSAEQAVTCGLAQEIMEFAPPTGARPLLI